MTTGKPTRKVPARRMTIRARLSEPTARRVLGLATAVAVAGAVAGGVVGVLGVRPATANPAPAPVTLTYSCKFPYVDNRTVTITFAAESFPEPPVVGRPTSPFAVSGAAPVSAIDATALRAAGIRSIEGTVDAKSVVVAPQGDLQVVVPFNVPRTYISLFQSFSVDGNGTAPSFTFSRPGRGEITAGNLTLHVIPRDANGNVRYPPGKFTAPCTLKPGQNNVLATFDITRASTAPVSTASDTPSVSAGSPPSGGQAGSTSGARVGSSSTAPNSPPAPGSSSTHIAPGPAPTASTASAAAAAADGENPTHLAPLLLGSLVVGTFVGGALVGAALIAGAVFRFGAPGKK